MISLSRDFIKREIADTPLIFERGLDTFRHGSYFLSEKDMGNGRFTYAFDGTLGTYITKIAIIGDRIETSCTCPYPKPGCRHAVAAALNAASLLAKTPVQESLFPDTETPYLSQAEIRQAALAERKERARSETFIPDRGDMFKGDHHVISRRKRRYTVCLHDPAKAQGHCSCPDYLTNGLGTCKHILFMADHLTREPGFSKQTAEEIFPFTDIFWDSQRQAPRLYSQRLATEMADLAPLLSRYFDTQGNFTAKDISLIMGLMVKLHGDKRVKIRQNLLNRVDHRLKTLQLEKMAGRPLPYPRVTPPLLAYQKQVIDFGTLKTGVLIGDETGLDKPLQAIALALTKQALFNFSKILVITALSLTEKWDGKIRELTGKPGLVIQGSPSRRRSFYETENPGFYITHFEAVIRDGAAIAAWSPDIIILDQALRIRNFTTQTAEAVKRLPKKHAIVLTGSPLTGPLEEVYSIVQFLDPYMLTPLWRFATDHYKVPRDRPDTVAGYKNLDVLEKKLAAVLIRRSRQSVADQLPALVRTPCFAPLSDRQDKTHKAMAAELTGLLSKPFLTPMDVRQIQTQLLQLRMASNTTYLLDRIPRESSKIKEVAGIIHEIAIQNGRKLAVFSEWTAMTFLLARHLTESQIPFVQLTGKTSPEKRKTLLERYQTDPDLKIILSTDAGSRDLAFENTDCLVNLDIPWTIRQLDRRLSCLCPPKDGSAFSVQAVDCVSKNSIEEQIHRDIREGARLFERVLGSDPDGASLENEDRKTLIEILTPMAGTLILEEAWETDRTDTGKTPGAGSSSDGMEETQKPAPPSPEKITAVMETGLAFLEGLMEITWGKKARPVSLEKKQIHIDPETGQVTLTFKLPEID